MNPEGHSRTPSYDLPICVDLDGTLLKTDTLMESALALVKKQPWRLFCIILWMLKGKAYLKHQIASLVDLRVDLLPTNTALLSFLRERHQKGQKIVLVTAANEKIAKAVADYLGIFAEVIASDDKINLKGPSKLNLLQERFGDTGFIYAGDAAADIPIWSKATEGIVVTASDRIIKRAGKVGNITLVIAERRNSFGVFLRAIRVHQWAKNTLLFVPLITSHRYTDIDVVIISFLAFISFSFCASGVYLINDCLDLDDDRRHPSKKMRPFAAGSLSLQSGVFLIPSLLGISFVIACQINQIFIIFLAYYFLATSFYSLSLKKAPLIDVFILALLYTIRVYSGAIAIDVVVSRWLLSFSIFIFISLGFVKRYIELHNSIEEEKDLSGRGYLPNDLSLLKIFGIASGYISVVVFALYIESNDVQVLYGSPQMLWFICVFIFYWISRIWFKANRNEIEDDPVLFAITDKTSYVIAIFSAVSFLLAT